MFLPIHFQCFLYLFYPFLGLYPLGRGRLGSLGASFLRSIVVHAAAEMQISFILRLLSGKTLSACSLLRRHSEHPVPVR